MACITSENDIVSSVLSSDSLGDSVDSEPIDGFVFQRERRDSLLSLSDGDINGDLQSIVELISKLLRKSISDTNSAAKRTRLLVRARLDFN